MQRFLVGALICAGAMMMAVVEAQAATFSDKLFLSADGLALSKYPGRHVLTRSVIVSRTLGKDPATWTASSDQGWLTVTPSGTTGDKLTVDAKVGGLAKDKFYLANVTVSTNDGLTDTETLKVGLWVGSTAPQTVTMQQNAVSIAANPVTPIAYVADGGSSILEFNVYSGALVGTLTKVAPTIGYMEVSSDGGTLFAADTTNYKIIALDTTSGAVLGKYDVGYDMSNGFDVAYARPYGQPALYIAGGDAEGKIIAYPSGEQLATGIAAQFLAVTPDGKTVFSVEIGLSPGSIFGYKVKQKGSALSLVPIGATSVEGENCMDLAISHDGKHVYPACGWPYHFDAYSGKTLAQVQTLPANPYPDNVEIDSNDDVVGGISGLYQQYDIYVFNQKGFSLGQVENPPVGQGDGSQPAAMKVSGDTTRVISATWAVYNSAQTLMFRNMP